MVVIVVALALIARRSKFLRRSPASLFGRRPGSGVKAARLAYRPETSLNVIENPIDVHEVSGDPSLRSHQRESRYILHVPDVYKALILHTN